MSEPSTCTRLVLQSTIMSHNYLLLFLHKYIDILRQNSSDMCSAKDYRIYSTTHPPISTLLAYTRAIYLKLLVSEIGPRP
ncbi:Uncharacterized protein HZ326_9645 [Fusarium oxysporum f. sp. albedinis]|nr:Uncharacterized protein HZ326_9645 [Fusarium oxysporum f. sp. albedinis]